MQPNLSLSALRELWGGESFEVEEPLVVGGVVTSSDLAGNFYRTFTIEDETGAAEIMAGLYNLYNCYPVGCRLCVKLEGCGVGVERGVVQIGLMPETYSNYAADYFYSKVLLDGHIVRSGEMVELLPTKVECKDLTEKMCGQLMRIEGLQLLPELEDENKDEADVEEGVEEGVEEPTIVTWEGYRAFADSAGRVVYIYTSQYATFAAEPVPTEPCDITGILQRGTIAGVEGECFILKMRSEDDCTPSCDSVM